MLRSPIHLIQVTMILVFHFSRFFCYFVPLRCKYSPQHPILELLQYVMFVALIDVIMVIIIV
jgi:hypothetical protein